MAVILKAEAVTREFGRERIIKGISLAVEENTFTAVLGPSGSGKSTLLNMLSGLIRPSGGRVVFDGENITGYKEPQLANWKRSMTSHVFQNYLLLDNLTAEENIKIGMNRGKPALSFDRLVRMLEIEGVLGKFPAQLSGGEQQRVAIARAVIKGPRLLFCDEATGALDEANSKSVVALLHSIGETFGTTILFATHNAQIARTAHRVLTIKDGRLFGDRINEKPIPAGEMVWG